MTTMTHMMLRQEIRETQQFLRAINARYSFVLKPVPQPWPAIYQDGKAKALSVWRSKEFFVVVFDENGRTRITVNRTMIDGSGEWMDGISWEELQRIKNEVGFADRDAVEVYPKDGDEVNVANMRHLWVLDEDCPFAWRKNK